MALLYHFFNPKKKINSQKMLEKATYAAVVLLNTYSDEVLEFDTHRTVEADGQDDPGQGWPRVVRHQIMKQIC